MADVVQFKLERMVDELDDLEKRGLFKKREIAEIVKKRRDFEYRLKRPSPLKHDFLAYIEYEKQLESLRKLRKKTIIKKWKGSDNGNQKWKKSISDRSCVKRVLQIYRGAVTRYKGDLGLWFQYLEYCREHGHFRMKEVLSQALRFHSKIPGLWIYAAAWEFDHNLNVEAARSLMHSGLRVCSDSEDLWVEYLRMELTFLNKLKARRVALGEDTETLSRGVEDKVKEKLRGEMKDIFMPLNNDAMNTNGLDTEAGDLENNADVFRVQGLDIFRSIYGEAIMALPSSMSLRGKFLEILDNINVAHSNDLKEEIMESIRKDFSGEEAYWDWLARFKLFESNKRKEMTEKVALCQLSKAIEVYEEALNVVPSSKMFSLYVKFWQDLITSEGEFSDLSNILASDVQLTSHLLEVFKKAESCGCISKDLAHQYISFYLQSGRLEEARELLVKLCNGKLSQATELCVLRVSVELKWVTRKSVAVSKEDLQSIFELFKYSLTGRTVREAESLWFMAIKFFSNQKDYYFNQLLQIFLTSLAAGGNIEDGGSVSLAFLNLVLLKDGILHARELYKRFFALPHPSIAVYRYCIALESNLAFVGDDDALVNARKLYESAICKYDQNMGLWQDYYSMEIKVGTSETANAVYWRARKTLGDSSKLISPSIYEDE